MSGQWISEALRTVVRQRAAFRCEYCQVHEADAVIPHEPDHIIALQHGGQTSVENLAYSCCHCNRFKGTNIASVDPQTNQRVFLFDPRRDSWPKHFRAEGPRIIPLTSRGRATAALLKVNLAKRVESRELLLHAGRYPSPALRER